MAREFVCFSGVRIRQSSSGSSPHPVITTSCIGVPSTPDDGSYAASIIVSVVKPRTSWPKTTCFPSSWGCGKVMIENCELLVFGPELAMLSRPGTGCEPGGAWGQRRDQWDRARVRVRVSGQWER